MFEQITSREFYAATLEMKATGGGIMLGGGTYSEYMTGTELYRYEVTPQGVESWYRFVPSAK